MSNTTSSPQQFTSTTHPVGLAEGPASWQGERALVLGGGGSTGNAWLIGVIAGLFEAGVDVTAADLTIGTSAGSTAAAQIATVHTAGATPAQLLAATIDSAPQPRTGTVEPQRGRAPAGPMTDHLDRMRKIIADCDGVDDFRRKMGAAALEREATSDGMWSTRWRDIVAARLPGARWPHVKVLITAVDAHTGEPVIFDKHSGVDFIDAVAASTAGGGSPYRIGDGRYVDGGYRSNADNADLAVGYDRVLVLSPLGGKSFHPFEWGTHLATQIDQLSAGGSRVEAIFPSSDFEHLFGANAMNPSLRPAAARSGHDQGAALAESLAEFWNGATA